MDVVTYALLKKYIDSSILDFVTQAEMEQAIDAAVVDLVSEDDMDTAIEGVLSTMSAGTEATAQYHLGFYLDDDGDLNQLDD